MAPEIIKEVQYDGKVDVWSLGVTAIEMATMSPPYSHIHPMRVLFKILRDPPPRLPDPSDQWSAAFSDFISRCCVKDPPMRPSCSTLSSHEFIANAVSCQNLVDLIKQSKAAILEHGAHSPGPETEIVVVASTVSTLSTKTDHSVYDTTPNTASQYGTVNVDESMQTLEPDMKSVYATASFQTSDVQSLLQKMNRRQNIMQLPYLTHNHINIESITNSKRQPDLTAIARRLAGVSDSSDDAWLNEDLPLTSFMHNLLVSFDAQKSPELSLDLKICLKTALKL